MPVLPVMTPKMTRELEPLQSTLTGALLPPSAGKDTSMKNRSLIFVPEFRSALFNLVGLLLFMILLGRYILVQMPGVPAAEMRAVVVPTHHSNAPVGLLAAHTPAEFNKAFMSTLNELIASF